MSPSAVFQMERSEWKDTITLGRLANAARAMECRLVYSIVPYQGDFEGQAILWAKRSLWRRKASKRKKKKSGRIRPSTICLKKEEAGTGD